MPQNDCISVTPKEVLDSAWDLKADIIADRREIHKHPETGICLPNTVAYVKKRLTEMGYAPTEICESGIVAAITGRDTGKCILLRADMDGLKVQEETAVEFKSENGMMHACGHDMHTAMLLGAAAILKKYQDRLEGTVKLVFQPDEEGFTGTKSMLNAGVLEIQNRRQVLLFMSIPEARPAWCCMAKERLWQAAHCFGFGLQALAAMEQCRKPELIRSTLPRTFTWLFKKLSLVKLEQKNLL